jgi:hypothetical protein
MGATLNRLRDTPNALPVDVDDTTVEDSSEDLEDADEDTHPLHFEDHGQHRLPIKRLSTWMYMVTLETRIIYATYPCSSYIVVWTMRAVISNMCAACRPPGTDHRIWEPAYQYHTIPSIYYKHYEQ